MKIFIEAWFLLRIGVSTVCDGEVCLQRWGMNIVKSGLEGVFCGVEGDWLIKGDMS